MRENVRFILLKKRIINFVCNGAMLFLALPFSVLITDDFYLGVYVLGKGRLLMN